MSTPLIIALIAAFLIVDGFILARVLRSARQGSRGSSGLGTSSVDDHWTQQSAAGAAGIGTVGVAGEGVTGSAPQQLAETEGEGAAAYESGFENPAPSAPSTSESEPGWSLGGGWSDASDSGGGTTGGGDSGGGDSGGGDSGGGGGSD